MTNEQKEEIAQRMADAVIAIQILKDKKKANAEDFNAKIKEKETELEGLAELYNSKEDEPDLFNQYEDDEGNEYSSERIPVEAEDE